MLLNNDFLKMLSTLNQCIEILTADVISKLEIIRNGMLNSLYFSHNTVCDIALGFVSRSSKYCIVSIT